MPKVTYTCPNCKEEFQDWGYRSRVGEPACSPECDRQLRHKESREAKAESIKQYKQGNSSIVPWMIRRYLKQLKRYGCPV